jgi:hypothetical protein
MLDGARRVIVRRYQTIVIDFIMKLFLKLTALMSLFPQ